MVAIGADPFVVCGLLFVDSVAADSSQIRVQPGAEFVQQRAQSLYFLFGQQFTTKSASEKMVRFVQGPSCDANVSPIIHIRSATETFGDVGSNTICGANQLLT